MNVLFLGNEHLHQLTSQGKYNLRIGWMLYPNMTSFIGSINNAVKILSIYFNSHVRIVGQIM
jgi:hypothetical protein